jgi:hypothetical protein
MRLTLKGLEYAVYCQVYAPSACDVLRRYVSSVYFIILQSVSNVQINP